MMRCKRHFLPSVRLCLLYACSRGYDPEGFEPEEPDFDEDEPFEVQDPDDVENPDHVPEEGENGAHHNELTDKDIVAIEDPSRPKGGEKKKSLRDKKVPEDKRTTTPYMTKYERARVLGTRALQIRCVIL